jgi:hypothetical protein
MFRYTVECGPCSTQRQARELISVPDPAIGVRLLSFNRTQSSVVISLLTGHNTLRRHLYIMGLCTDPMPEWEKTKWPTRSQGMFVFGILLDLSLSWGFLGRIYEETWNAGWRNSIWHYGVVLVVHRDRLGNWSLTLIWLQRSDYCPLTFRQRNFTFKF